MIRLKTLGSLDLRDGNGAEVGDVLRQPKRFAVLTFLALARPRGFHRRDALLVQFWPESSERRARRALSQQVLELRKALGPHAVISRGDEELGVSDVVSCDATEFEAAIAAGELERALQLYAGPFLDSFHVGEARDFEDWMLAERARFGRAAAGAAQRLADECLEKGDAASAVRWSRRALELNPHDEPAIRRLMASLEAAGDRAGAVKAHDEFAHRLYTDLEMEPSHETREAAKALLAAPSQPLPASQAVRPAEPVPVSPALDEQPVAQDQPQGPFEGTDRDWNRLRRQLFAPFAAVVAAIAVLAIGRIDRGGSSDPPVFAPSANRIAVLFFDDESEDGELRAEAAALNTGMIAQLSELAPLEVISQNGVRPYRDRHVPPSRVAEDLHAGIVIAGSLTSSGDRLRAFVEVIDGVTGIARSATIEKPRAELFALVDTVTEEVLSYLRPEIGMQLRRMRWKHQTESDEAWRLLYEVDDLAERSRQREDEGDSNGAQALRLRADSLLVRAAALDPKWAQPWVMAADLASHGAIMTLAGSHDRETGGSHVDRGLALADRALEIDRNSAPAHEMRGRLLHRQWLLSPPPGDAADSLLTRAEEHLRRALELESERPRSEAALSFVFFAQGRFEESRRAAERAYHADAYQFDIEEIVMRLFQASFEMGDDDGASAWCDEVGRRMPNRSPHAHCTLILHAWSGRSRHDPQQALLAHANAGRIEPPRVMDMVGPMLDMTLAAALARAGIPDSARSLIRRTHASNESNIEMYEAEAAAWMALGDANRALDCLATYVHFRPTARARLAAARIFQPLRDEPGFVALFRPATQLPPPGGSPLQIHTPLMK